MSLIAQTVPFTAAGPATSFPVAITPGAIGNAICLVITYTGSAANAVVTAVSDNDAGGTNIWADQVDQNNGNASPHVVSIWTTQSVHSSGSSITITITSNVNISGLVGVIYEITGQFKGTDFGCTNSQAYGSGNPQTAPVLAETVALANEQLIIGVYAASTPTISASAGWTADEISAQQGVFSQFNPATGAYNAQPVTISVANAVVLASVAFVQKTQVPAAPQVFLKKASGKFATSGIYELTSNNLTNAQLAARPGWTFPGCAGLVVRNYWNNVQTGPSTFNYGTFDYAINTLCPLYNKPISIQVNAGVGAWPSWIQNTQTGTCTNGSNIITGLTSTTGLLTGMVVAGTSWPVNPAVLVTIQSIDSPTQIHVSANYTGTTAAISLTFGPEQMNFPDQGIFNAPWDPTYQTYWQAFINNLGARYDGSPYLSYLIDVGIGFAAQASFCTSAADNTFAFNGDAYGGSQATFTTGWIAAAVQVAHFWKVAFPRTPIAWSFGPIIFPNNTQPFFQASATQFRVDAFACRLNSLQIPNTKFVQQQPMTVGYYSKLGGEAAAFQENTGGATLANFLGELQLSQYIGARTIEVYPGELNLNWVPYIASANLQMSDPFFPYPNGLSPWMN